MLVFSSYTLFLSPVHVLLSSCPSPLPDKLKQLAEETRGKLLSKLGTQNFVHVYNSIEKKLKSRRDKKKQEEKLMAVVNPMRNAKRKMRVSAKNRAYKKRKILTMKMGRWMHWLQLVL